MKRKFSLKKFILVWKQEFSKFGDFKMGKQKLHSSESAVVLDSVDVNEILVSRKFAHSKMLSFSLAIKWWKS